MNQPITLKASELLGIIGPIRIKVEGGKRPVKYITRAVESVQPKSSRVVLECNKGALGREVHLHTDTIETVGQWRFRATYDEKNGFVLRRFLVYLTPLTSRVAAMWERAQRGEPPSKFDWITHTHLNHDHLSETEAEAVMRCTEKQRERVQSAKEYIEQAKRNLELSTTRLETIADAADAFTDLFKQSAPGNVRAFKKG